MKLKILVASVLLVSTFLLSVTAQTSPYDPWYDFDDDGDIDIFDTVDFAGRYGTTGTPINKTALILDLQERVSFLEEMLYDLFLAGLDEGLVARWKFDEGNGSVAYDSSEYDNHGIIYDANWTTGRFGQALEFNGINSFVEVADSASLDVDHGVTLEAWIKVTGTTGDHQMIVDKWYPTFSYALELQPNGMIPQLGLQTGGISHVWSSIQIPLGSWAHIAATYEGSTNKIYVNGTLAGNHLVYNSITIGNSPLYIGSHSPVEPLDRNWFKGIIDEVSVYERALSAAEIKARYLGFDSVTP